VLPFGVIKLENFRPLQQTSTRPTHLSFESPWMRGIPSALFNRELTMRRASASQASNATGGTCSAISSHEHQLLELSLTCRKQTMAPRSNRELPTNPNNNKARLPKAFFVAGLLGGYAGWPSSQVLTSHCSVFLLGSALNIESDVTLSRQTIQEFLAGATTTYVPITDQYDLYSKIMAHQARNQRAS
jgi:hypothetical protein